MFGQMNVYWKDTIGGNQMQQCNKIHVSLGFLSKHECYCSPVIRVLSLYKKRDIKLGSRTVRILLFDFSIYSEIFFLIMRGISLLEKKVKGNVFVV